MKDDIDTQIAAVEAAFGAALPDAYREFLVGHDPRYLIESDDREWWLATAAGLLKRQAIDRHECAAFAQLGAVSIMLRELGVGAVRNADGSAVSLGRLAGGFVIGEQDGDFLYLDPDDGFGVCCYHHDGEDVARLAPDFATWLARSRRIDTRDEALEAAERAEEARRATRDESQYLDELLAALVELCDRFGGPCATVLVRRSIGGSMDELKAGLVTLAEKGKVQAVPGGWKPADQS